MTGSNTIISTVKIIDTDTAILRSVFLALDAAPTAMAADVPQTLVAVARVMTSGLFSEIKNPYPLMYLDIQKTSTQYLLVLNK